MPFWDEVFQDVAKDYPEVTADSQHIDALSAFFVTRPEKFDVIVASNLFGDILTDLGADHYGKYWHSACRQHQCKWQIPIHV